ncbi:sugar phosphate isomerase/epimerase family protein [Parablautia muri]|uniref:Sugar phosphate isomerase/epimerase n=1 Tax=Parablautia muri TaxID=2320879 RepID=A0A9X5GRR4_9FIRM|nr:sugar phosphate isomerase/epimerase family protein [Parablautia muri]NBJ92441.1 sugar phosphate isomerase/epimerase [Parablautia muri]
MKIAAFYENIIYGAEKEQAFIGDILDELKAEGLQMIYISWDSLKGKEEELMHLFGEKGLAVEGLHQHFDFGHHPEDESYKEFIELALRVGAANCLIVPGLLAKEDEGNRKEMIENMIGVVKKAVEYGKERGILVCMEDYDSMASPYNSVEGLSCFFENIPELKCAFDTGNFVCFKEDEEAAFSKFADKICTVHLKDRSHQAYMEGDRGCVCYDGSSAWSTPIGSGYIRIKEILGRLKKRNYEGNVIVELYGYEDILEGIKQSIRWVRQQAGVNT